MAFRRGETKLEWKLNEAVFGDIVEKLHFQPVIDLFASRLNKQLSKFVSYRPDPEALHINAFSLDWGDLEFYCFPPFSCIGAYNV